MHLFSEIISDFMKFQYTSMMMWTLKNQKIQDMYNNQNTLKFQDDENRRRSSTQEDAHLRNISTDIGGETKIMLTD